MWSRSLFFIVAAILFLGFGNIGTSSAATLVVPATAIDKAVSRSSARGYIIEARWRGRRWRRWRRRGGLRLYFYFGTPYYYGYYPYYRYRYRRFRRAGRCGYWHRRCARNWGYGNANYRGCMRYHGCW